MKPIRLLQFVLPAALLAVSAGAHAAQIQAPATKAKLVKGINVSALYANSRSATYKKPFGAVPAGTTIMLAIRTAHGNASKVTLHWLDANLAATGTTAGNRPMKIVRHTARYDYWQTTFKPTAIDVYYYDFVIRHGSGQVIYANNEAAENGVGLWYRSKVPDQYYHLTSYQPGFVPVPWIKNAVMYEIFPDRFYDGDRSNNDLGMNTVYGGEKTYVHPGWDEAPILTSSPLGGEDFFGGDLRGIIDKLPYLKSLGVNTLYLTPIFLAPSDHKYDTANYFEIDPRFGTQQEFNELVSDVHEKGMHLILDGVFNHTSSDSIYFNKYGSFDDVGAYQSKSSPYYPFYTFINWPNSYNEFGSIDTLPQLAETDAVKDFIFRQPTSVAQYCLKQGADGWRLDAAIYKSHQWWQEFRQSVKTAFPNDVLICECDLTPRDQISWLLGTELDGSMNYNFRDYILGFFANGRGSSIGAPLSVTGFINGLMSLIEELPPAAIYSSMNLVGSHDTDRILDLVGDNVVEMKEVAAFQATWQGMPMIYYGDEAGLTGEGDDALRRKPFPWDHPNTTLQAWYARVFNLRDQTPALRDGSITPLAVDNAHRTFAFERRDSTQAVAVAFNDDTGAHSLTFTVKGLPAGATLVDAINGGTYSPKKGKVTVKLAGHSVAILVPKLRAHRS